MTPKEALKEIANTTISSRMGDWRIESRHVSDLSSTKEPLQIIEQTLNELEFLKCEVKRYFELYEQAREKWGNGLDDVEAYEFTKLHIKLSKVGNEE